MSAERLDLDTRAELRALAGELEHIPRAAVALGLSSETCANIAGIAVALKWASLYETSPARAVCKLAIGRNLLEAWRREKRRAS